MPDHEPQNPSVDPTLAMYQKKPSTLSRLRRHLRGRYHWAIVVGLLLAIPGALVGYLKTAPQFRSNGMLRITPLTLKILYAQNDIVPSIFESFVDVQCNIMKSRPIIESVIHSPEWLEAHDSAVPIEPELFLRNLEINHPVRSEVISVSYNDVTPAGARDGVRLLIQEYLKVYGDRSGNQRVVASEERSAQLTKKLTDLRTQMAEIANEYGTDDLKLLHQAKVLELSRLEAMVKDTQINLILAEASLGKGTTFKNMPAGEIASSDDILRKLLDEKHRNETELAGLRNFAGEMHPDVRALKNRSGELDKKIDDRAEEFRNFRRTSFVNNMGALEGIPTPAAIDSLKQRLEKLQALLKESLDRSLEIGRKSLVIANLQEEYRTNKERLSENQNKLDQLRVDTSVVGQINVISDGDLPLLPIKDRRRLMAAGGGAGGFVFGFGLVAAFVLFDRRLRLSGDLSACGLDLPLLGTLPARDDPQFAAQTVRGLRQIEASLQLDPDLQHLRVLALTPARAGAASADVSSALAVALARSKQKTLLIDFDFAHPELSRRSRGESWRMDRPDVGLAQALAGAELRNVCFATDVEGLSFLPWSANGAARTLSLAASDIRAVLRQAAEQFDRVIVHVGALADNVENSLIVKESESVVLCADSITTDLQLATAVRGLVSAHAALGGVVFNPAIAARTSPESWLGDFAQAAAEDM
jgi:uncharacterized protein involved in exopolysaccharide biosynthesis/Mrp family chromosome partitioning ATPase